MWAKTAPVHKQEAKSYNLVCPRKYNSQTQLRQNILHSERTDFKLSAK